MGIQLLSGFGNMQSYYRTSEIPAVSVEEIKKSQQAQTPEKEAQALPYSSQEIQPVQDTRSRVADLENISLTFNKEESYDYIGSESGLANLNVQKAVSDMRKDSVLQEYQYFVGSAQNLLKETQDGIVIPKPVETE